MDSVTIIWASIGTFFLIVTLPGTIELLLITLGVLLPRRRVGSESSSLGNSPLRLAVVIPAHNEEAGIQRTVRSLQACEAGNSPLSLVVIADNCTDQTVARAHEVGVRVLERQDTTKRGKGFALAYAFNVLLDEGFDALMVIDADTVVEPNLIMECQRLLAHGADAIQVRYLGVVPDSSIRARLVYVAMLAFNHLRPRSRDCFGFSAGILGNGFVLSKETLRSVPFQAEGIAEDLEYHLALVTDNRCVRFTDATTVRAEIPASSSGTKEQHARWEGGRFRLMREQIPSLFYQILNGRWRLIEPTLELLLLPLAFHVLLVLATFAPPFYPTRMYALVALTIVILHIVMALVVGGAGRREVCALAGAPFYLLWKVSMIAKLRKASRKDAEWVRTKRDPNEG